MGASSMTEGRDSAKTASSRGNRSDGNSLARAGERERLHAREFPRTR